MERTAASSHAVGALLDLSENADDFVMSDGALVFVDPYVAQDEASLVSILARVEELASILLLRPSSRGAYQ